MTQFDQRSQQIQQQYNAGHDIYWNTSLSLSSEEQRRNRCRMLAKVRAYWITGLLERSLRGAAMIELALSEQPDAVAHPRGLILHSLDQLVRLGADITDFYDEAGGELLILGEPGAGKTMLLLELARDLLNRADRDTMHFLPVVFNLSSWSAKRMPLVEWLVEELNRTYQVPRKQARTWVDTDQMLLLLDGLDEVASEHLSECVEAINAYRREHGLVPIVICSRRTDYCVQTKRLQLHTAVVVQPLTETQIEAYFSSTGKQFEAIHMLLRNDPELREMATSPLMLSILTRTYAGRSLESLQIAGIPKTRQQVFADYIEAMLQRRDTKTRYPRQQTIKWLAWLAWQLARHNQVEFYLERIQPDWLEEHRWLQQFYRRTVRASIGLFSMLILGLIFGPIFVMLGSTSAASLIVPVVGLVIGLTHHTEKEIKPAEVVTWSWKNMWQKLTEMKYLHHALLDGLIAGLVIGLVLARPRLGFGLAGGLSAGLIVGLISVLVNRAVRKLLDEAQKKQLHLLSNQERKYTGRMRVFVGLVSGLLGGLIFGLSTGFLGGGTGGLVYGLVSGLGGGLFGGLVCGLITGLTHRKKEEVRSRKTMIWLWANIWQEIMKSEAFKHMLIIGLIFGLWFGLSIYPASGLFSGLMSASMSGLVFEFISGIVGGLSSRLLDKQMLTRPNQGIQRSGQNSVLVGLIGGLVCSLLSGLVINLILLSSLAAGSDALLFGGPFLGLLTGLPIGLSIGLSNGGAACIQHIVLQTFLWRAGHIPWNYAHFLDYAAEHILLRKVGGGYIFVHRLLLDYFVSLHTTSSRSV